MQNCSIVNEFPLVVVAVVFNDTKSIYISLVSRDTSKRELKMFGFSFKTNIGPRNMKFKLGISYFSFVQSTCFIIVVFFLIYLRRLLLLDLIMV